MKIIFNCECVTSVGTKLPNDNADIPKDEAEQYIFLGWAHLPEKENDKPKTQYKLEVPVKV